jgi:hypothetical protein
MQLVVAKHPLERDSHSKPPDLRPRISIILESTPVVCALLRVGGASPYPRLPIVRVSRLCRPAPGTEGTMLYRYRLFLEPSVRRTAALFELVGRTSANRSR